MGYREAIFVDKSTFDFPIFLLFFNAKFPIFPIFSILSFLFSYFFLGNHAVGHPDIICTKIYLIVIVIFTEGIRMIFSTLSKKIEAYRKIPIFFVVE